MEIPAELKFTESHEWVRSQGEQAIVGITEFAQSELGELVFCELPAIGKTVSRGETLCVVESTKAASDVYAPISGKVVAVNDSVVGDPSLVNSQPYAAGWLVKLEPTNSSELSELLEPQQYRERIGA